MSIITKAITGGGGLLAGFPIWLYIVGALTIALAAEDGLRRVQVNQLRAEVATEAAERAKEHSEALTAALALTQEYSQASRQLLKEKEDAQTRYEAAIASLVADRDAAVRERGKLRQQVVAFADAARRSSGNPGALAVGTAGGDALDLFADLFSRADQRAGELSEVADRARASGLQCEREYDAVKRTFDALAPAH